MKPEGGKAQTSKRIAKARKNRIGRLRYLCDVYCKRVLGASITPGSLPLLERSVTDEAASETFFLSGHSFDYTDVRAHASNVSPLSLATTMEQVVSTIEHLPDAEARDLAELSTDALENRLTAQHKKIGNIVEGLGDGSISSHASSIGSMVDIEQLMPVIGELGAMEATASLLATSHFKGVATTVLSRAP